MTAKEEAIRLYDRYFYSLPFFEGEGEFEHKMSKLCALILVDEVIAECDSERVFERIYFWNEVKKEIEKL
jgi:hypothetical protein